MKSKSIKILEKLAWNEKVSQNPNMPRHCLVVPKFSDKKANDLTKAVIKFISLMGYQGERISVTGRKVASAKKVRDTFTGESKIVGKDKYIKSSMRKGSADISSVIEGHSVKIEIKVGKDWQSDHQKEYQAEVEQAGGTYLIVRTFDQFYNWFMEQNWIKNKPKL